MQRYDFASFETLRSTFPTADKVGDVIVFNIGGNKYRLIAAIHCNRRKVCIRHVRTNRVRISDHADEEAAAHQLSFDEIFLSVLQGEIIEDYPTDTPYPSCLIYGQTFSSEPVHSVWAYNAEHQWAVLITVYRPDPNRWITWREKK